MKLNEEFWEDRWANNMTKWDVGRATPPITTFMSTYPNKDAHILIPGCGNAYEAEFLVKEGFTNITLVDIAETAVHNLQKKFEGVKAIKIKHQNFFDVEKTFDLVLEQTFFCALDPKLRPEYAKKMASILKQNGQLVGVLFGRNFETEGPPFGGTKAEYEKYFEPYFNIVKMEDCDNSIGPRQGNELFIDLQKK